MPPRPGWKPGGEGIYTSLLTAKAMSDMASDHGPVVQSAVVRGELVRRRKGQELTQDQVATNLGWAASTLIRAEGGRSCIADADLDALLRQYGVDAAGCEQLRDLNRGSHAGAWWDGYSDDVPPCISTMWATRRERPPSASSRYRHSWAVADAGICGGAHRHVG